MQYNALTSWKVHSKDGERELEDVAEKARRNLMAVASGILAVWGLGIPLDGKLVGAVDLSSVEPWRAWAAASAVLLYFALRHYFAPSTHKVWGDWSTRRKVWFISERHRVLNASIPRETVATKEQIPFNDGKVSLKLDWMPPTDDSWISYRNDILAWNGRKGFVEIHWLRYIEGMAPVMLPRDKPDLTTGANFSIRRRSYLLIILQSWAQAYKLSWSLLELSFPWVLAFGAALVCVCKLAASAYYSFPFIRQLLPA